MCERSQGSQGESKSVRSSSRVLVEETLEMIDVEVSLPPRGQDLIDASVVYWWPL